ncbi:MAG: BON domain-containing protein [Planctomyces sp.]|nr:BON domain-containing protein [Planctomyces sp.]
MIQESAASASRSFHTTSHSGPAPRLERRTPVCPLSRAVRQQLESAPYRALKSLAFDVQGRTVTLRGQVRSFFMKQMAQHIIGQLDGIEGVRNELQVA